MASASVRTSVPVAVVNVVSSTIVSSTYCRVHRASASGATARWPASSSSSRPSTEGLSKRGKHSQSTDPARLTRAAQCRSESSA